jgi:hypothetical protein
MDHEVVNYGQLPVFFKAIPKSGGAFYKIKLISPNNTESDSKWYKTNNDDIDQYGLSIILLSIIFVINAFIAINIIKKFLVNRKCESSCIKINM